jgi:hypothetical protein
VNSLRIFAIGAALLVVTALLHRYEPLIEALAAIAFVLMIAFGFVLHPRKDVFYIRTSLQSVDRDRNLLGEHDQLAVKVEPARLWLLFLPTFLAVAFLVVTAAQGTLWKFSLLNRVFSDLGPWPVMMCRLPVFLIGGALWIWIGERRVLRDAEACSARSATVKDGRVSFMFVDSRGGYGGGDDLYFGLVQPRVLATLVFYNVENLDLNKIGMSLLFHRPTILGRGLTDLDHQTVAAHTFSPEIAS